MKPRNFFPIVIIFSLLFIFSCGESSYNTDYPSPTDDLDVDDVFPAKIFDLDREVVSLMKINEKDFRGTRATYGEAEDIVIEIINIRNEADYNTYIDKYLIPEIDKLSTHSRKNINGNWSGSGNDDLYKLYAWTHDNVIFKIKAKTELFEAAITEFNYISAN